MPDGLTHALAGVLFARSKWFKGLPVSLLLIGALLPDVIQKPIESVFPQAEYYLLASHSVFLLVPLIAVIALMIRKPGFIKTFYLLGVGVLTHLGLDSLQYDYSGNYYPVFAPFSYARFGVNLYHSESWIFVLLFMICGILIAMLCAKARDKGNIR